MSSRLLPLLLLPLFALAVDFQGPAVVECPTQVWEDQDCRPSYDPDRLFECVFSCPEGVLSSLFPKRTGDIVTLDLPCDCIELLGCPDDCVAVNEGNSGTNSTSAIVARADEPPQNFEGPGLLKCPLSTLLDGTCEFGYKEDCAFDATTCVFPEFMDFFDGFFSSQISIPLSCSCVEAKNCSSSCEFEPAEVDVTNSTSFQGVGTISCPVEDFLSQPCLPLDLGGECSSDHPECVRFDVTEFLFNTDMDTVKIPLPCGCLSVAGCPASCTFAEGMPEIERANFTGSGKITCPLNSYLSSPCTPWVKSGEDCGSSVCLASAYTGIRVQNASEIEISIPCDCLELQECSADCTFTAMDPIALDRAEFSGPGSVTCPFALDSIISPCDVQEADGCNCTATNVLNQDGISVNLPCDCLTATCSSKCQYTESLATLPFESTDLEDGTFFQGPGLVTCPTADYNENPCSYNTANAFECLVQGNSCLKLAFDFLTSADLQGDQIQIPLDCECVQLVGCPDSCVFEGVPQLTTQQFVREAILGRESVTADEGEVAVETGSSESTFQSSAQGSTVMVVFVGLVAVALHAV